MFDGYLWKLKYTDSLRRQWKSGVIFCIVIIGEVMATWWVLDSVQGTRRAMIQEETKHSQLDVLIKYEAILIATNETY